MRRERRKASERKKQLAQQQQMSCYTNKSSSNIFNVSNYKCKTNIPNIYYIPNFISEAEEQQMIQDIESNATKKQPWIQLTQRRLMNMGGIPHSTGMIKETLPPFIKKLNEKLSQHNIVSPSSSSSTTTNNDNNNNGDGDGTNYIPSKIPNHVLLNEYVHGKGISPHKDGPLYEPNAIILSLNSSARIDFLIRREQNAFANDGTNSMPFTKNSNKEVFVRQESVLLMPRSLLIFNDDAYDKYYHGIKTTPYDIINMNSIDICNKAFLPNDNKILFPVNNSNGSVGESVLKHARSSNDANNNNSHAAFPSLYIPRNKKRFSITLRHAKLAQKKSNSYNRYDDDDGDNHIVNQEAMIELKRRELIWYKNICENKNDIEKYIW
eukprot:g3166.t1